MSSLHDQPLDGENRGKGSTFSFLLRDDEPFSASRDGSEPPPRATDSWNKALAANTAEPSIPQESVGVPEIPGYQILRVLGRGGMAVVYLALDLKLGREVAIKALWPGEGEDPARLARLHAEARAVAGLHHPDIVQIYKIDEYQGYHYFVMEYMPGGSLADRMRAGPVDARQAVEWTEQMARAVHFAHQNHVIHRDLKPGNVLIGTDGRMKIADFGLVKRIDQCAGLTRSGEIMGTPEYMAPEQMSGNSGAVVGPLVDLYALGAIFYELLTGRPPFQNEEPLKVLFQALAKDPPAPSTFDPSIDRELDTICLRCLEKEPYRRYPSALSLADDLMRWRNGEPISARPINGLTRSWYWCRRRPVLTSLVAALVISLVAGTAVSTWTARAAVHQRDLKEQERVKAIASREEADRAKLVAIHEAEKFQAVNDFLTNGLLAQADPTVGAFDREITLRAAVDRAAEQVAARFGKTPELEAEVSTLLSRVYSNLGAPDLAERYARRAIDLTSVTSHLQLLQRKNHLALALGKQGNLQAELELEVEIVQQSRRILGRDALFTIEVTNSLAATFTELERWSEAEPLLREGLEARLALLGPRDAKTLTSMNNLAAVLQKQGKFEEAETLRHACLEGRRGLLGPDHPSTLTALNNLGMLLKVRGKYQEADQVFQEVVPTSRRVLGDDHPSTLVALNNHAQILGHLEQFDQAVTLYEECLTRAVKSKSRVRFDVMNNYAVLLIRARKHLHLPRAEQLLSEVFGAYARIWGETNSRTINSGRDLARVLQTLKKWDEAESVLLTIESRLNRDGSQLKTHRRAVLHQLVQLYREWGRPDALDHWQPIYFDSIFPDEPIAWSVQDRDGSRLQPDLAPVPE